MWKNRKNRMRPLTLSGPLKTKCWSHQSGPVFCPIGVETGNQKLRLRRTRLTHRRPRARTPRRHPQPHTHTDTYLQPHTRTHPHSHPHTQPTRTRRECVFNVSCVLFYSCFSFLFFFQKFEKFKKFVSFPKLWAEFSVLRFHFVPMCDRHIHRASHLMLTSKLSNLWPNRRLGTNLACIHQLCSFTWQKLSMTRSACEITCQSRQPFCHTLCSIL